MCKTQLKKGDKNMFRKKFEPSFEEYNLLRQEIINRISIVNSQSHNAILTILTIWASGFLFLTNMSEKINENTPFSLLIIILSSFLFLVPIFYFIPLSMKSSENIKQIMSISTYIIIFYEYKKIRSKGKFCSWETANYKTNDLSNSLEQKSSLYILYNGEYSILAFCSLFISLIIFLYFGSVFLEKDNIGFLVVYVFIFILGALGCLFISRNSFVNSVSKVKRNYLMLYLNMAKKIGYYSENELKKAANEFNIDLSQNNK